jgi:hypothetical protein
MVSLVVEFGLPRECRLRLGVRANDLIYKDGGILGVRCDQAGDFTVRKLVYYGVT